MNRNIRLVLFLGSVAAMLAVLVPALHDLPPFGHYRGPYGDVIASIGTYERHVTDMVTAVNFDFRGFDTLGEEVILFLSVVGGTLLLRPQKDEHNDSEEFARDVAERAAPDPSDAVRAATVGLIGPLVAFGLYIVAHGQLTPGGGFQGGVILATAPLLVYIADDLKTFKRITNNTLVEAAEGFGIFCYVAIGLLGLIAGANFLQNVLPLGVTGEANSGGTIMLVNAATGLAVAAGFVHLLRAFVEQTIELRSKAE